VVGLPPGGAADAGARAVGLGMERIYGKPVVIENKPGGNFNISVRTVLAAPADGQTLLYGYGGYAAAQVAHRQFDLEKDLIPVSRVGYTSYYVLVRADSPYKTLDDLIQHARKNPGKLTYATIGPLGFEDLLMIQFKNAAKFSAMPVPYRGGPDAVNALMAGDVDFGLFVTTFATSFTSTGKTRALAVLEDKRQAELPGVPTMKELGFALQPINLWGGIFVRAGTPDAVVRNLHKTISESLAMKDVAEKLAGMGNVPWASESPEEFRALIRQELAWMGKAVEAAKRQGG
jgi:tripartite-type tricarboxylate transporter receptor subunit TctC